MKYVEDRFPATRNLNYSVYYDPLFNSGFGDIEYMPAEYDYNMYPLYPNPINGQPLSWYYYLKPINGLTVIVHNSNLQGDVLKESIALDAMSHGLREQDPIYREEILPVVNSAFKGWNPYLDNPDTQEFNNEIDGLIRNHLVKLKLIPFMNYDPTLQDHYNALQRQAMQLVEDYVNSYILPEIIVSK